MDNIRIGTVGTVNYQKAMVSVVYTDMNDLATAELPYFSFTGEYKMPKVGEQVLVLHLSNGESFGVVLGGFYSEEDLPKETGEGLFYKQLTDSIAIKAQGDTLELAGVNIKALEQRLSILEAKVASLGG
jgi:phage-related baseplate assembly protein